MDDPDDWGNSLWGCTRWEFLAYALRDCGEVLDVGCGDGWPSLYLAHRLPEVVGLDISPRQIALARNTARLARLTGVRFEVGNIMDLPFGDASFGGVCFGGNVFTYHFDTRRMLREIRRVLRPGGVFAFEQRPGDPGSAPREGILWFIDGGPPIVHYHAGCGPHSRAYLIYVKRCSSQGRRLAELATRMAGLLSEEQRETCEEITREVEAGNPSVVERAIYSGEDRSLAAGELPVLLDEAGFADFASWAVPDGCEFARSLQQGGALDRLTQEDLLPYIRALAASSVRCEEWVHDHVTCRKA